MQPDSRMRIASASKTLTSVAMLHLVEKASYISTTSSSTF
jgi:CubicO group peptidase (beta-lactamase class C family)